MSAQPPGPGPRSTDPAAAEDASSGPDEPAAPDAPTGPALSGARRLRVLLEIGLIFLLFFLVGGWLPPDVNEAHYLGKARHYWDPSWCARDVFLESADAHVVFYWTIGWLTRLVSLPTTAWVGRVVTWLLLAWAWRRLSYALIARPWVAVLTAAVYLPLQIGGDMAGEWVVGGLEAKGFAYVLVLWGLEALVRRRWGWMWIRFGAASAFHVLVGGWSVVAGLVAWGLAGRADTSEDVRAGNSEDGRPPLRAMLPALILGGLLSLPGLLPTAALNLGQSAEVIGEANAVYVLARLPHHLVFTYFRPLEVLAHVGVLAVWLAAAWSLRGDPAQRQLHRFVAGAVVIGLVGVLLSLLPRTPITTGLLRFYWFRLSDATVPLGAAMGLVGWIVREREAASPGTRRARLATLLLSASLLLPAAFFVIGSVRQQRDLRPLAVKQTRSPRLASRERLREIYEDWVRLGAWIADHTEPDAVFITPRLQQTFHWFAERAEVACWKNVPQDAASMVHWWERMESLYPPEVLEQGLVGHGEKRLRQLAERYGARYIVLDRTLSRRPLGMQRVYPTKLHPNDSFEVYRVLPPNRPAAPGD